MRSVNVLVAAYLASACTGLSSNSSDVEMAGGVLGEGNEAGESSDPSLAIGSSYALRSSFEIPASAAAPALIHQLLTDLHDEPGTALITLADAAGVPAASRLFDALPESLADRIGEWITDAVDREGLEELRAVVELSQTILTKVDVESTLTIGALDSEKRAHGNHTLASLSFSVGDQIVEEDIPQIDTLPGAGHSSVAIEVSHESNGVRISLEEQRFGLLLGEAAYRAFEGKIALDYGSDLRGVLGDAINCDAVAQSVSDRCVLGVCVGHQEELEGLCEGALDSAAAKVREQFRALDTEVLLLEQGDALVESTQSGTQLVDGTWQAQADFGLGMRSLPASFAGQSF